MRTHLRTAIVTLTATVAIGCSAAGAFALGQDQPAAPRCGTASLSDAHGNEVNQAPPHAKRTYVKTVKLKGGMSAKVYKLAKRGHQAELFLGRAHLGTITAVEMGELTLNDGVHVKLTPDGTITSWTEMNS
ncbi:hypothetical protein [Streptomyces mesophilus]|uniref:hypothetical protein n=1 Tax=Streptomyces mesophilus TaxID=1775132 RepID=UPI00331A916B